MRKIEHSPSGTSAVSPSPETELLLCCAQVHGPPARTEQIRALLREEIDWHYLLLAAYEHGVMPQLFWNLDATCPEAVPETVLNELRDHFRSNHLHNLFLTGELLKILREFEARGILAIPYKGPVLAAAVYENLALRQFGDLDILVHKQDVPKAREALLALEYRPQYRLTLAQEAAFLRYEREYTFKNEGKGSVVELHWEIAPRPFSFSLETERLWDRSERGSLMGDTITTFSPEDLLFILCVHGAAHFWGRLGWIRDVAELIRAYEGIDWELLMRRASMSGSERMLLLGLLLASDVSGADLPEWVSERMWGEATVKALAGQMRERLFRETEDSQEVFGEESHFHPLHLRMMERSRDKIRYCIYQATAPILKDWALRPLPVSLFPLYYVLRPMRLAGRYGQKLLMRVYD